VPTCCVCAVAKSLCLSWVVMLCACEQVVDVELGSGVPHISNLQALASPSSTIWPQALFDLDFTGNTSICTQHTWGSPSVPSVPFWAFWVQTGVVCLLRLACFPMLVTSPSCTFLWILTRYSRWQQTVILNLQELDSGGIKSELAALKHA